MDAVAQDIAMRTLGPGDLALLCATPPGVFDHDVTAERAQAFLADPANVIVVAMDRGTICAMATGTVLRHPDKPPHLFVNEVGVRDGLRGRGIGRALMAAMLGAARARGCAEAWVATEADNSIARALYRGAGGAESEPLVMYEWTFDDV